MTEYPHYKQALVYVRDYKLDAYIDECSYQSWEVAALTAIPNRDVGGHDFCVVIRKMRVVGDADPAVPQMPDVEVQDGKYVRVTR